MKHPLLLVFLPLIGWSSLAIDQPIAGSSRCLVYNEASLMVASLAASTENALLTFGLNTYTIIAEVGERIGRIISQTAAVGEHLCSEVWRLTVGNSWIIHFLLYHPLALLAGETNQTLQTVAADFTALGTRVERDLFAHTELVGRRLLTVVRDFMHEVTGSLRNATHSPASGACAYSFEEACSLVNMRQVQLYVVQCVTRYGRDVLDRLVTIETEVRALRATVNALLDGIDVVEQESASQVSGWLARGEWV